MAVVLSLVLLGCPASREPEPLPAPESPQASETPRASEAPQPIPLQEDVPVREPEPAPVPAPLPARASEAPTIDFEALQRRLRETDAIGVFTKLSLKNQVGDFVEALRAHHEGAGDLTLDQLRQRYELLLMKILSLLREGDAELSRDISDSREALWSLLANRESFAQL
jgi:hypothetical protein